MIGDRIGSASGASGRPQRGLVWVFCERELYGLAATAMAVFLPQLIFGQTLFWKDLSFYFLPQRKILVELVQRGEWPLWNPWLQGGQAFMTSVSNAVLAPANLMLLLLSPLRSLNLTIALYLLIAVSSTYLLARVLGLGRAPGVVAALAFAFSGVTLSLINLLNHFLAVAQLPLLLALWLLWLRESTTRWLLLSALVATLQLLVGSPEISALSLAAMAGVVAARSSTRAALRSGLGWWCVVVCCTLALGAVQLAPTVEVVRSSPRGYGFSPADLGAWSLHPRRLPEIVLPRLLGNVDVLGNDEFWGEQLVDDGTPYLLSIYFGSSTLLLALWGGLRQRGSDCLPLRVRRWLLALVVAAPIVALGRHIPGVSALLEHLPLASLVRYPSKLIVVGVLPCALLAGWAVDAMCACSTPRESAPPPAGRAAAIVIWLSAALAVLLGIVAAGVASTGFDAALAWYFATAVQPTMRAGVTGSVLHAAALVAATALLLVLASQRRRAWLAWGFVAVVAVDLGVAGARVNPSCPEWVLLDEPPVVRLVRSHLDDGRLYRSPPARRIRLDAPDDNVAWMYRRGIETLAEGSAAMWGLATIFHRDVVQLSPLPLMKLKLYLDAVPWDQKLPILRAAAVTVIVTDEPLEAAGLELLGVTRVQGGETLWAYRLLDAARRVAFVGAVRRVGSDEAAFDLMRGEGFDPRAELVVVTADGGGAGEASSAAQGTAQVTRVRDSASRHVVHVRNPGPGYLVFAEPYAPGWRAVVDGEARPLVRANIAFSALRLEAGEHRVEYFYRPRSLVMGAAVSLAGLLLMLGLAFAQRRR